MKKGYEADELRIALSLIKDGDCVLDVGANVGFYSTAIAKKYPFAYVHAFEPIPDTFNILYENARPYKNIYLHNFGLSDRVAEVEFYYNKAEPGAASMRNIRETKKAKKVLARTQPLDTIANFMPSVDFIKCDVEGAELLVIKGGYESIQQYKPVILMEMLRKWADKFGYTPNDTIDLLSKIGYRCYRIVNGKLKMFRRMTDKTEETNFFFIHKNHEINNN